MVHPVGEESHGPSFPFIEPHVKGERWQPHNPIFQAVNDERISCLLIISFRHFPGNFQAPLPVDPAPLSVDPATCPIVPGQDMIIEISKGRSGLGLSIVGGKDTPLVSM